MHDYYYGGMITDLLNIEKLEHKHETINEKQEKMVKISKLNENDGIWVENRTNVFQNAIKTIVNGFNIFIKNNSAAKMAMNKSTDPDSLNIEEMGKIIKEMPHY